ncbi:glycosyltransferase [Singulisphaera acidiphila]|uniref:Putative glycosyltransferase n=1 Tax=Singulisphaera acidiphila (strain ATCC BAA-1392 / DSM 18658 / VKM B-2454 / MOB10) TaxID=886293 RepID=L0DIF9_SINAD|nr:glycosyltransferase [Singulisphaera acidiphila]AGA28603.1 putative glycosyltransferase [Singulisphaera acidiphila DSM 18658]
MNHNAMTRCIDTMSVYGPPEEPPVVSRPNGTGRILLDGKFLARDGKRFRIRGVTYGPFAPDASGGRFPSPAHCDFDLFQMAEAGINALRTYHVPPAWLLEKAEARGMALLIDVPWPKHLCFLQSVRARAEARRAVREAAEFGRKRGGVLAYCVGNEVPPDIVRWHGVRRVERFLADLCDVAHQADPERLVTYANYPPTEYLDLSSFDLSTFNVYLHDPAVFRSYLLRLQNLTGERPLLLGELGMDTMRNGESAQAAFLSGHLREAMMAGLAGAFVFSWTDDWHTGGHQVENWAFGVTQTDRTPKAAYHALQLDGELRPHALLRETPRVSVVVCTYNGGRTLDQCLQSLQALDYPDYEVIVVDDGSTDATGEVLERFPEITAIRQANLGLSVARNVGLATATGSIIAYTDSDCFADPDWLSHLVDQLNRNGAAAVGGPNLTPDDGWLAGCIAASPGQPTHVLLEDQLAEHVPGCNMAFRREALEAIHGFDPGFRTAGDDVDVCWRLQNAGYRITFAPGACVWHHRRHTPRRYFKQQAGYGEAEALLSFTHPDRFTAMGSGKWHGVVYGPSAVGLRLSSPLIYRGTFGTGLFQCVYQPNAGHWAMLPSTLEWHAVALATAAAALVVGRPLFALSAVMIALSVFVAALRAAQARPDRRHLRWTTRPLIALLCYLQPLVRSWFRYRTRLIAHRVPREGRTEAEGSASLSPPGSWPWFGPRFAAYWSENGPNRIDLLRRAVESLNERKWARVLDSGWSDWDLGVYCRAGLILKVCTVQEDHGGGRCLIRVCYRLSLAQWVKAIGTVAAVALPVFALTFPKPAAIVLTATSALLAARWWQASRAADRVVDWFDAVAGQIGLTPCPPLEEPQGRRWISRKAENQQAVASAAGGLETTSVGGPFA